MPPGSSNWGRPSVDPLDFSLDRRERAMLVAQARMHMNSQLPNVIDASRNLQDLVEKGDEGQPLTEAVQHPLLEGVQHLLLEGAQQPPTPVIPKATKHGSLLKQVTTNNAVNVVRAQAAEVVGHPGPSASRRPAPNVRVMPPPAPKQNKKKVVWEFAAQSPSPPDANDMIRQRAEDATQEVGLSPQPTRKRRFADDEVSQAKKKRRPSREDDPTAIDDDET